MLFFLLASGIVCLSSGFNLISHQYTVCQIFESLILAYIHWQYKNELLKCWKHIVFIISHSLYIERNGSAYMKICKKKIYIYRYLIQQGWINLIKCDSECVYNGTKY